MNLKYSTFKTETNGELAKGFTLFSMHFGRLSYYKKSWSIDDILVFEAMLVLYRNFGNRTFFHQMPKLERYTRLTSYRIDNSLKKLRKLGFIQVSRSGRDDNRKNYYSVNYEAIKNNLRKIYDFSNNSPEDVEHFIQRMKSFYDFRAGNFPEKENDKSIGIPPNERDPIYPKPEDEVEHEEATFSDDFVEKWGYLLNQQEE